MSADNEQEDGERDGKLLPDPPGQGGYGINDWDGSRRSWTGIPQDGSWIEKVSDKPFRLRVQTPRPLHEHEPERVGYGKPPVEKRFKPGQSGNPKGRQLGSKNKPKPPLIDDRFGSIVLQEYYREVTVPVQGEMLTLPIAQVAMRMIMTRAAKGHVAAMKFATDLATRIEAQRAQDELERFQQLVLLKQDLTAELERRKHIDCTGLPPVLPHPDDIYIDLHQVTAEVRGPWTVEDKIAMDQAISWLTYMDEGLAQLRAYLDAETDPKARRGLRATIKMIKAQVEEARSPLPDWFLERVKPQENK